MKYPIIKYPIYNQIKYSFYINRFSPLDFTLEKEDNVWDIVCSEYNEEIGEIVYSHIYELNKWKDIKILETLGLENLDKLSKLINEAMNNLEDKNDK